MAEAVFDEWAIDVEYEPRESRDERGGGTYGDPIPIRGRLSEQSVEVANDDGSVRLAAGTFLVFSPLDLAAEPGGRVLGLPDWPDDTKATVADVERVRDETGAVYYVKLLLDREANR